MLKSVMLQKEESCKCDTLEKEEKASVDQRRTGLGRGLGSPGHLRRMPATEVGTEAGRDPGCWEDQVVLV